MENKKTLWPAAIITLIIAFIGITGWSVYRATSGVSSVTDPGYYSHGLKYNTTSVETIAAETMGWVIKPKLSDQTLELTLSDKSGTAISGGTGSITFLANPSAAQDRSQKVTLVDAGHGTYLAQLPAGLTNNTSASIILNKGQATIQRTLLINR